MLHWERGKWSAKVSFMSKVFSSIFDYVLDFDLLSFQYDRWCFKTVADSTCHSAREYNCSAVKVPDAKEFSPGCWQGQHCYLMDAVQQHGFQSLFITISPYGHSCFHSGQKTSDSRLDMVQQRCLHLKHWTLLISYDRS